MPKQCSFVNRIFDDSQERDGAQWHQDTSSGELGVGDVIAPRYRALTIEGIYPSAAEESAWEMLLPPLAGLGTWK